MTLADKKSLLFLWLSYVYFSGSLHQYQPASTIQVKCHDIPNLHLVHELKNDKMKQIVLFWNRLYFCIFNFNRRMQLYYYKVVLCISNSVLQCCKRKPLKAKKNVIEALVDAKCSTIILVADVTMLAFTHYYYGL